MRRSLPGISPEAYRHPLDSQAAKALRAVPGFELAATKLSRYALETALYTEACASSVRVTPRQCGKIYALLVEACRVLDVPLPALFLSQTPIPNAFALGSENPTIMIHTGLVELMNEEELLSVIAHELGHIHCGHSVYRLMAMIVVLMAKHGDGFLGAAPFFSVALQIALLEWQRKAEFTADRAAILVTQNPETVFNVLFKLTGGSPKIYEQMDRDEYLRQAAEFDRRSNEKDMGGRSGNFNNVMDRVYKLLLEVDRTHPVPVLRAREVLLWGAGDDCKRILSGEYVRRDKQTIGASAVCPNCRHTSESAFSFCTHCGASLTSEGER